MASTTSKPLKRLSLLQSANSNSLHDASGSSSSSVSKIESRKESSEDRGSDSRTRTISRPSPLRIHSASDMAHIAVIAGPSTAPLSLQTSPTSLNQSHRDYPSPNSPAINGLPQSAAKRAFARDKSTRRQSSICYISSTSNSIDASESSAAALGQELSSSRRSPKSSSPPASATFARSRAEKRRSVILDSSNQSLLRNEVGVEDDQGVEVRVDSSTVQGANGKLNSPLHDRQAMTLVEKHADLLHFIAQKESKCLELRAQLATHEAELLELKRKWEKIVSRGYVTPTTGSGLPGGSVTAAVQMAATPSRRALPKHTRSNTVAVRPASVIGAAGLREGINGVGRLIAAGLGELTHAAPTPITILPHQQQEGDSDSASTSTRSPAMSAATSARLSQSSMSSFASEDDAGGEKTEVENKEVQTTQNRIRVEGEDAAESSRADRASGLTKPITPPSIHSSEKYPSLTSSRSSAPTIARATKAPISPTIPAMSTETSGLRRRRSAGHKSAISPLSHTSPLSSTPISSNKHNELHVSTSWSPAKTSPSSTMSSLPPPSSLLGLTALASLAMPSSSSSLSSSTSSPSRSSPATNSPLSSLPLTLPLQKRTVQTVQTVHKRASAFLADASTSFFAALGSPQLANFGSLGAGGVPPPSSPSSPLPINPSSSSSQMKAKKRLSLGVGVAVGGGGAVRAAVKSCAPAAGGRATTRSLLDDDDDRLSWNGDVLGGQAVMVPDQPTKAITPTPNSKDVCNTGKEDLTEEWPAWS